MRTRIIGVTLAILLTATYGCVRPPESDRGTDLLDTAASPQDSATRDSAPPPTLAARPPQGPGESLVGTWDLRRLPPAPPSGAGLRLTVRVDSVVDHRILGRVTQYLAGNVGRDPEHFRPLDGQLTGGSDLVWVITPRDPRSASLRLAGALAGDTIHLASVTMGRDSLSRSGVRWVLVRER